MIIYLKKVDFKVFVLFLDFFLSGRLEIIFIVVLKILLIDL